MNEQNRFVDFYTYCPKCSHWTKKDAEDPCNECLSEPTNGYSAKPVRFEEKDSQKKHDS